MATTWDCIVLGVGGMGSAAAAHLARRGVRVLGLEQHPLVHDWGSSHGETRIIRKAYFEHPDYVPLLQRAYENWRSLEAEQGRRLFEPTGLFLCGPESGEAVGGTLLAAKQHSLPLESLSPAEARRRFEGFRFPEESRIVFERDAGFLHVEACVRAHCDSAQQHGATLRSGETVCRWTSDGRTVRVFTDREIYEAASLIITAGPWASRLLREIRVPLVVLRKVLLWFESRPAAYRFTPCFLYEEPEGEFYGFPSLDGTSIKVAEHTGGDTVDDPALVDRLLHPADVERVRTFVTSRLSGVSGTVLKHRVCLYTKTPDSHFLIDRHPEFRNVAVGAGFSGHGFKFASVIGEVLADLALNGETSLPVGFLGLHRFSSNVPSL